MLIQMTDKAKADDTQQVLAAIAAHGGRGHYFAERGAIGAGGVGAALASTLGRLAGVASVTPTAAKYTLASRSMHAGTTPVRVGDVVIGGPAPVTIAGPCTVESEAQLLATAQAVRRAGASLLRGGAFKPRTSPYSFQGMGEAGLRILARARAETGLPIVTEVMEPGLVGLVAEYADMLQIGARNMQNYPLLREAGRSGRPVMVKRGMAATIEDWLLAAEYVLAEGNPNVVLCERGVRSFDPATRFMLDLAAVPLAKALSHLPVIVDPSHGTGRRELVASMAVAAIAAGADGLMIEAHLTPDNAVCDGDQSIEPSELATITARVAAVKAALG